MQRLALRMLTIAAIAATVTISPLEAQETDSDKGYSGQLAQYVRVILQAQACQINVDDERRAVAAFARQNLKETAEEAPFAVTLALAQAAGRNHEEMASRPESCDVVAEQVAETDWPEIVN